MKDFVRKTNVEFRMKNMYFIVNMTIAFDKMQALKLFQNVVCQKENVCQMNQRKVNQ